MGVGMIGATVLPQDPPPPYEDLSAVREALNRTESK